MEVGSGAERVSIRMAERAGEIRMAVVTPHRELAGELRARLPELVERLEHQGFAAETWKPEPASASRPDTGERREPGQGWTGGERGSSGQDRQGRERQGRPQWLEELDDSTERSEFEWQPFLT